MLQRVLPRDNITGEVCEQRRRAVLGGLGHERARHQSMRVLGVGDWLSIATRDCYTPSHVP
jgi:hypothetical protein